MTWDSEGNLYLTVGNNTGNPTAGTSALDERAVVRAGMISVVRKH